MEINKLHKNMKHTNEEEKILEAIFGDTRQWKGYKLGWCSMCETAIISGCSNPECTGTSCNGAGCEKCVDAHNEFNKLKTSYNDYLTEKEQNVLRKAFQLQKFILFCLEQGKSEIDWNFLREKGQLCLQDYFLFNELKDLREEGVKDYMKHGNIEVVEDLRKEFGTI